MSKTSRTPDKKITKKRRASDAEREKKKKQVSGVATSNSLDNCEQLTLLYNRSTAYPQLIDAMEFEHYLSLFCNNAIDE